MAKKTLKLSDVLLVSQELKESLTEELKGIHKWDISKVLSECEEHFKNYEKIRLDLCKKYGTLDEKTDSYTINPESQINFKEELSQLLEKEIKINSNIDFKNTFDIITSKNPYHKINLLR